MELELAHADLIAEEEDKINSLGGLPIEIKKEIAALKMRIGHYTKTPTESTKDYIEKKSVEIADEIQDFIEKDLPEEDDDEKKSEEQRLEDEKNANLATAAAEKEILDVIAAKGKIYSTELKQILKSDSVDSIPDKLEIGSTVLERSLGYYYKK